MMRQNHDFILLFLVHTHTHELPGTNFRNGANFNDFRGL